MTIAPATDSASIEDVRALFLEYAASLDVDLGYQGFADEVAGLPGDYAAPRGVLLLARDDDGALGCVGVRAIDDETCEMKRLYVRPRGRGTGLGRTLTLEAIAFAQGRRYRVMRLDTLPSMRAAQAMYRALGFREIPPYRHSPVAGNLYMELDLEA